MTYKINPSETSSIRIETYKDDKKTITIYIKHILLDDNYNSLGIDISKDDLHEFIGALLHAQSKLK